MNQLEYENHEPLDLEADAESDVQFGQSPQVLAIITVILGLLSFLALFNTMFWVFPIVTIVLGIVSLFSLARNPEKIGRKAALLGLTLAIFFGSWAASRYFSRQQWLYEHARQNAEIWLQMIKAKNLRVAHQLQMRQDQRVPEDESLDDYYKNDLYAQADLESFMRGSPVRELLEVAPKATIDFVRFEAYKRIMTSDDLVLRYVARYEQDGAEKQLVIRLVMRRSENPRTGVAGWWVYDILPEKDLPKPVLTGAE